MKIIQRNLFSLDEKWVDNSKQEEEIRSQVQLVLAFGSRSLISNPKSYTLLKNAFPTATIVLVSSSGNILGMQIFDENISVTAIAFRHTQVKAEKFQIKESKESFDAGALLASKLPQENLVHVLVFSDALNVNGSELVKGIASKLPKSVNITGGLAGDDSRFEKTFVGLNSAAESRNIALIGLYGKNIRIGYGSVGGWDPFGPQRIVTKSQGNKLYSLDNQPALELYKKYLGEHVKKLPGSALLFPLSIKANKDSPSLVRSVLKINEEEGCLIFAGDVPEGYYAQLMKANFEKLIDGASLAANSSYDMLGQSTPDLALLISCVGRRMVLSQRTEEELESVHDILGKGSVLAGFYSYGEIAPTSPQASCELHNQTMTITTIREV